MKLTYTVDKSKYRRCVRGQIFISFGKLMYKTCKIQNAKDRSTKGKTVKKFPIKENTKKLFCKLKIELLA